MKNMDLEISQNLKFQKMEWRVVRFGWIIMLLFVLSGIVGLFGDGFVSKTSYDAKTFILEYDRFQRYQSDFELKVSSTGTNNIIKINKEFVDVLEIKNISPEPVKETADEKYISYHFENYNGSVLFKYAPTKWGNYNVNMILNNSESIEFNILIFP